MRHHKRQDVSPVFVAPPAHTPHMLNILETQILGLE